MEQNFSNNRGNNGYNGQDRNVNNNRGEFHHAVNNNLGGSMNARPEVDNTCAQSSKSTLSMVAQHVASNKTVYGVSFGAAVVLTGFGILAYKKGWIFGQKKTKKEPAPAAAAEPKPAQEAAGESK